MSLAISTLLSMSESTGSTVEIAYYEIYMERCYDLLEPKAREISVYDDKDGRVQLKGLSQVKEKGHCVIILNVRCSFFFGRCVSFRCVSALFPNSMRC